MGRNIRKFTFDSFIDFDRQPEPPLQQNDTDVQAVYSQSDLDQARAEAFEEGRTRALVDHEGTDTHRLANAIEKLAGEVARMGEAEALRIREFNASAMNVALAAVRKVMPELTKRFGPHEVDAVMADALSEQHDEPRLVFRIPDALFESATERVAELAGERGYAGKTVILADAALGPSDCRIEWADGGVERLAERTLAEVANAIIRLTQNQPTNSPIEQ